MVTGKGAYVAPRRECEVLNRDAFRQIALYRPARRVDTLNAASHLPCALHNLA
ncbi:hypothetical protein K443DRAFT_675378 [Laccaria amethystina LaAM-08-1]|uniref:Uncharacterized protein n=1 Tax=Laccaria amethystina LaAM-08-1 TaxID=1095629 RepID=A0A0C9WZ73_9AGAR|nr:hypothetical protein K443DRAFT_675378 [Laccaria amethystina LaAM-08-1]